MNTLEITFRKILSGLAEMYRVQMNDFVLDRYITQLTPLGLDKVNPLLASYIDKGKFPIIDEIKKKLGACEIEALSDEEEARLIAARVIKAVSKYGYTNPKEARDMIGEKGWSAVTESYGWSNLCETLTVDNETVFAAQFRELVKATRHKEARDCFVALNPEVRQLLLGD
jgi:hypothetical protein